MFNAEIETLMKTRPSVVKLGLSFQHLWLVGMGPLDFIDNQILIPNFRFVFEVCIYVMYVYIYSMNWVMEEPREVTHFG